MKVVHNIIYRFTFFLLLEETEVYIPEHFCFHHWIEVTIAHRRIFRTVLAFIRVENSNLNLEDCKEGCTARMRVPLTLSRTTCQVYYPTLM